MIPYEDLVSALQNWRAKQGLPVAGAPTAIASGGSGSNRTAAPAEAPVAADEVDGEALIEEAQDEDATADGDYQGGGGQNNW